MEEIRFLKSDFLFSLGKLSEYLNFKKKLDKTKLTMV